MDLVPARLRGARSLRTSALLLACLGLCGLAAPSLRAQDTLTGVVPREATPPAAEAPANELYYAFDSACAHAYRVIIDLRLGEGRELLRELRRAQPDNLVPVWLEDYADFFQVYIDEDESDFERLEATYLARLARLRRGPRDSPYHRYAQANVMLHWALARLKFGEYFTALRESRRAYKLLEDNLERFPDFALSRKELGVLQAAVATVPQGYQWGVEMLTGMDGDLAAGRDHLERVLAEQRASGSPFLQETSALYAFLLLHLERDADGAWARMREAGFDAEGSLLGTFVLANIAMRTGRNDEALRLLSARPNSPRYYPFPYLDFMHGVCLQRRLDPDAKVYLRSYVDRKRDGNFIKEAYQKLAWEQLIRGDEDGYRDELQRVRLFGQELVGSDKNAMREAERARAPNVDLLRARLLYDGGYHERAAGVLADIDATALTPTEAIELPYRGGRIAAARGRTAEAKRLYVQTLEAGATAEAYFACKAAVELGAIAEDEAAYARAREYYRRALDLHPSEYAAGLHQQAKAGLARIRRADATE